MNTNKIDIKLSELLAHLDNGLTWYKKEDVGYGSIQETYNAKDIQIKLLQQHPKLVGVKPTITVFNVIVDVETSEIKSIKKEESSKILETSLEPIINEINFNEGVLSETVIAPSEFFNM